MFNFELLISTRRFILKLSYGFMSTQMQFIAVQCISVEIIGIIFVVNTLSLSWAFYLSVSFMQQTISWNSIDHHFGMLFGNTINSHDDDMIRLP